MTTKDSENSVILQKDDKNTISTPINVKTLALSFYLAISLPVMYGLVVFVNIQSAAVTFSPPPTSNQAGFNINFS